MGGHVTAPEVRGRADELRALRTTLDQARRGNLRCAFIQGEAGMGKTRLVSEMLDFAEGDFQAIYGRADELDRSRPFAPLLECFRVRAGADDPERAQIAAMLAGALPSARVETAAHFQISEAFVDLVERAALDGPLLVALDDLQWADPATLQWLRAVTSRLTDLPVALIAAFRPWPARPEVERLANSLPAGTALTLTLEALSDEAIARVAADKLRRPPGSALLGLLERTQGNPFFAVELLDALVDDGQVEERDGHADTRLGQLPPTLRITVLRRLSTLPAETLATLRAACVLGSAFALEDLEGLLDRPATEAYRDLEPALQLGIVETRGDRLAFRHDLIREAIYDDIPPAVRRALHRDAAHALAASDSSRERAAEQFLLSASPGDEQAIEWLREAARNAAASSTATAIELYEAALGLTDPRSRARAEIAADLSVMLVVAGRSDQVEALSSEVSALALGPPVEAAFLIGVAEAQWNRGDTIGAHEHFSQAAALPGEAEPYRSVAAAFAAQLAMLQGDPETAKELAEPARASAAVAVRDVVGVVTEETLALVAAAEGRVDDAVAHGTRAVQESEVVDSEWAAYLYPHIYLGMALLDADRFDDARATARAGRHAADALGNVSWLPALQWIVAGAHLMDGSWSDALAEAEAGLALAEEVSNTFGALIGHGIVAQIAVHQGELELAERHLDRADEVLETSGFGMGTDWVLWGRALLQEATGDSDAALASLEAAWEVSQPFRYTLGFRSLAPRLVRLAMEAGDSELAMSVTGEVERAVALSSVETVRAAALRCRGLAARDAEALRASVAVWRAGPRPFERALTCEDAAAIVATGGRSEEAVALLDEALEIHSRVGAAHDAARVTARLRDLGERRGVRGKRARAKAGWDALTPTEQRVARLAAQRLTNGEIGEQLFISKRTVQTHLKHIFEKLGISSRRDVADHLPTGE